MVRAVTNHQKTGHEILGLFEELHKAGQTIVLVTHDPDIAEKAERVIEIRDGEITADRPGSYRRDA